MTHMHPSRRHKGCGLCKPHKVKGYGQNVKDPFSVSRKLGKFKRRSRKYYEED